jgi:Membrane bound O-acyl transferase family
MVSFDRILDPSKLNTRSVLTKISIGNESSSIVVLLGPISFWIHLISMLIMQAVVSSFFAVVVYKVILPNRDSKFSFLFGFGIVIPMVLWVPFLFIRAFGVMNTSVMVGAAAITVIVPFNYVQAYFNTSPPGVESSLPRYVGYYASILPFERDYKTGKPKKATIDYFATNLQQLLLRAIALICSIVVMAHYDYAIFPSPRDKGVFILSDILHFFHWGHLLNNFTVACLTYQCLDVGTRAVSFLISSLTGFKVIALMKNPIFGSQSPSDFWGRRWNLMIHDSLKRGMYMPLLKLRLSRPVAMLATFIFSGILHEYVCSIIYMKHILFPELFKHMKIIYGRQFLFFVWNGIVVLLEYIFSPLPFFQWIKHTLPKPLITAMVLFTVLPISHWFTDGYIQNEFYSDFSMGFPFILYSPGMKLL